MCCQNYRKSFCGLISSAKFCYESNYSQHVSIFTCSRILKTNIRKSSWIAILNGSIIYWFNKIFIILYQFFTRGCIYHLVFQILVLFQIISLNLKQFFFQIILSTMCEGSLLYLTAWLRYFLLMCFRIKEEKNRQFMIQNSESVVCLVNVTTLIFEILIWIFEHLHEKS